MCEFARNSTPRNMFDSPHPVAPAVRHGKIEGEDVDIGDVILANFLKLMRERSLTLEQLAELAGIALPVLEDLVSGRSFPSVELLWKLAQALDIRCTAFIEEPPMATSSPPPRAMRTTFA